MVGRLSRALRNQLRAEKYSLDESEGGVHRMPVYYRYDFNIIKIYMAGEYSIIDLRTTLLNSLADPERLPSSFLLFNIVESQSIYSRSTEEIQTMVDFIASMAHQYNYRLAIVSSHDLPFILQRFVSVKSKIYGIDAEVFRSDDEAREWLMSKPLYTYPHTNAVQKTKA